MKTFLRVEQHIKKQLLSTLDKNQPSLLESFYSTTHPAQVERLAENVQIVSRQVSKDDVPAVHDDVQADVVQAFLEQNVHHHGYSLQHDVGVEVL